MVFSVKNCVFYDLLHFRAWPGVQEGQRVPPREERKTTVRHPTHPAPFLKMVDPRKPWVFTGKSSPESHGFLPSNIYI